MAVIRSFLLLTTWIFVLTGLHAQQFGDTGTLWKHCYVDEPFGGPADCCYATKYHSVDSFSFQSATCHNITYTSLAHKTGLYVDTFCLCNIGQRTYYKIQDSLYLLYDFGLGPGESYTLRYPLELLDIRWDEEAPIDTFATIFIDSVENVTLNDKTLRRQYISSDARYCLGTGRFITELIGFEEWILPTCPAGTQDCCYFSGLMEFGAGGWSFQQDSETCRLVPVKEPKPEEETFIYPNPTTGFIHIDSDEFARYDLFDLSGRNLKSGPVREGIDIGSLPDGIYFLVLYSGQGRVRHKLMKM